jgi:hypothetical protein
MFKPNDNMIETLNKLFLNKSVEVKTENKYNFSISYRDIYDGVECYKRMKEIDGPQYEIFGSNGMGYTCYSLYKSPENKIYLIEVSFQTPISFMELEDDTLDTW